MGICASQSTQAHSELQTPSASRASSAARTTPTSLNFRALGVVGKGAPEASRKAASVSAVEPLAPESISAGATAATPRRSVAKCLGWNVASRGRPARPEGTWDEMGDLFEFWVNQEYIKCEVNIFSPKFRRVWHPAPSVLGRKPHLKSRYVAPFFGIGAML